MSTSTEGVSVRSNEHRETPWEVPESGHSPRLQSFLSTNFSVVPSISCKSHLQSLLSVQNFLSTFNYYLH